jgi:hypothetical protein
VSRKVPFLAGLAVFLAYAGWKVLHTGAASADEWGTVAEPVADRLRTFLTGGEFWMGASYALSAGFTAFALSVFRENHKKAAVGAAGGVAVAGVIYGLGCFLLGCCGSPMLPIYIGLLGGKWAKISGPLMFGVTLASVALGVRMLRRKRACCCEGTCDESGNG